MKQIIFISILIGFLTICVKSQIHEVKASFYLAENGLAIVCENCQPGDTGTVNGTTYYAVDHELLRALVDSGEDLTKICTSLITDMSELFIDDTSFNQYICNWDVSNVTSMRAMFEGATKFNEDIRDWDVSNVTDMSSMFRAAESFNQDLSWWDVSNVTDMNRMFAAECILGECAGDVAFNQGLSWWDVGNVTDMSFMFAGAAFDQDIGSWDVRNVKNMKWMFCNNKFFGQDISHWCVENITSEPENFALNCPLQTDFYPKWGTCPSAVSMTDINNTGSFTTFPNPASTFLTIETGITGLYDLEISSLNGHLLYQGENREPILQLDLSSFQPGIYIITIRSMDFVTTRKIIKL